KIKTHEKTIFLPNTTKSNNSTREESSAINIVIEDKSSTMSARSRFEIDNTTKKSSKNKFMLTNKYQNLSVSLLSSREFEGLLKAKLLLHAFSSDSENAHNTSINTQAASSTVPEPSAQAANISINTQAVSDINTISIL
ncbi:8311_t:CDS:2, partial [Funneliformis caledonium]